MNAVLWVNRITYPVELARAIEIAPNSEFVKSTQEFYETTGYLSPNQRMALIGVTAPRRRRSPRSYRGYTRGGTWMENSFDESDFGCDWGGIG
jgi:hypothetical protein